MLTETDELQVAWSALTGVTREYGWVTVPVGEANGRFRAGINCSSAEEVLIMGSNLPSPPASKELPEGEGFRVEVIKEAFDGRFAWWIGLVHQTAVGRDLFLQMSADLMSCVNASAGFSEKSIFQLMLSRIVAWQQFMQRRRDDLLSSEEEIGLFGELTVLSQVLKAGVLPSIAVNSWVGPLRGLRDFELGDFGIEVKSTTQVVGFPANINSLDQLDAWTGKNIFLAGVRLCSQEIGFTLSNIIEEIRLYISKDKKALRQFERLILISGFDFEKSGSYIRKFHCSEIRMFLIDESFPKLARSEVDSSILKATYTVDLDLVKTQRSDFTAILPFLGIHVQ